MVDWNLISIIIFYALIVIFFLKNRKKINIENKIFFLYRMRWPVKPIRALALKFQRFWKWFGYAAIPVGFGGMAFIFAFLAIKAVEIFRTPEAPPALGLVLPGVRIPGSPIYLPFWYGIIALLITIIVHELAHGLVSESWKLKLKSAGIGLFLFLPLAFVEPDERKLANRPLKQQLAIFGAGSFSNILTGALVLAIMVFAVAPVAANVLAPQGLFIEGVEKGYPAAAAGLQKGEIITFANGIQINTTQDFVNLMHTLEPGDRLTLRNKDGTNYTLTTTHKPNNVSLAYIGIKFSQNLELKPGVPSLAWSLVYLSKLLYWIFVLNIGIGLINLLPFTIMDGGRMLKLILEHKIRNKKLAFRIWTLFTTASLALLLLNLVGPYLV